MFSRFFIDRPIFAAVLSIFIVLAGLAAMRVLPISQYPEIAPPVVTVTAIYPGASAPVLESTVASPLENAINGVEDMLYMSSTSSANGVVQIQVTFNIGADIDKAALNVNNRVKQAEPRPVEAGQWSGDRWVISSGLKGGERVIVDGVMKIGPGAPVRIAEAKAEKPVVGKK